MSLQQQFNNSSTDALNMNIKNQKNSLKAVQMLLRDYKHVRHSLLVEININI